MAFYRKTQVVPGSSKGLENLVGAASKSPLSALGEGMSKLDAVLDRRDQEQYTEAVKSKFKDVKSTADLLGLGVDTGRLTKEGQTTYKSLADLLKQGEDYASSVATAAGGKARYGVETDPKTGGLIRYDKYTGEIIPVYQTGLDSLVPQSKVTGDYREQQGLPEVQDTSGQGVGVVYNPLGTQATTTTQPAGTTTGPQVTTTGTQPTTGLAGLEQQAQGQQQVQGQIPADTQKEMTEEGELITYSKPGEKNITGLGYDITGYDTTTQPYNKKYGGSEIELPNGEVVQAMNGKIVVNSFGEPNVIKTVENSMADKKKKETGKIRSTISKANLVFGSLDRAINVLSDGNPKNLYDEKGNLIPGNVTDWWSTELVGSMVSIIPGSDAWKLQKYLGEVENKIAIKELMEMKENSPTGGALGQVTEKELALLQAAIADLSIGFEGPDLLKQIEIVRKDYQKILQKIPVEYFLDKQLLAQKGARISGRPGFEVLTFPDGSQVNPRYSE